MPKRSGASREGAAGTELAWAEWIRTTIPAGGVLESEGPTGPHIVHTVDTGESLESIAGRYLDLTTHYVKENLVRSLRAQTGGRPVAKGTRLEIGPLVDAPTLAKMTSKLRWPEDKALRGLYVRGVTAGGRNYVGMLERMVQRGMNMIVLDAKDYDGWLTYDSKVPLAIESGAVLHRPPIPNLSRAIRFAHAHGVMVAVRISCFEDEIVAKARGDLSIQAQWGRPYRIGWLDPSNEGAQKYLMDLAAEVMEAGADEIQLDYVRYPVLGIKGADFKLEPRGLTKVGVITDFVRKMHALTRAHDVPLSLDVFGIIAEGKRADIDQLGQDPAILAAECEALSPMVYPSHYRPGYGGFDVPGNHPEIVGMATRKIIEQIGQARTEGRPMAVVRPWLQAASFNSPEYGPQWVASEVRHAESAGSRGWLMWNPTQTYTVTWRAVPPLATPPLPAASPEVPQVSAANTESE